MEPPDLPHSGESLTLDALTFETARYRYLGSDTVRMVLIDLVVVDEVPAIMTILKVLQPPLGAVYLGSLTFPFAEFSFVLKLQCEERGITGMRETALLVKALSQGTEPGDMDDERYDYQFPDHPVSRLRREFALLQPTIRLRPEIKRAPAFRLPRIE